MRLLLVDIGNAWGGAQRWGKRLAEAWTDAGHRVEVIATDARFRGCWGEPDRVPAGRAGLFATQRLLAKQTTDPDVILFNNYPAAYLGVLRFGAPTVVWLHEPLIGPATARWKRRLKATARELSLRRVDRVVCVGREMRESLPLALWDKANLVTNGVADRDVAPPDDSRLRVAFIGRLDTVKRVPLLLAAMSRLRAQEDCAGGRSVALDIAGDGPERPMLERMVAALKLGDCVSFLGEVDDVNAVLGRSNVLVLPSIQEGLPLTVLEAYAARRPVVGFAVSGLRELVRHEETGLLCTAGATLEASADALAAALARLYRDPALARNMGNAGRRHWHLHYREESSLMKSVALLEETACGVVNDSWARIS